MLQTRRHGRSPTVPLLLGFAIALATVLAYSWYISVEIGGLRRLQVDLTDRNRRDSLQLLRIQNDLNQLALAMRDMLDPGERYPLFAWSSQFDRVRADLDDALKQQEEVTTARRTPEQAQYLVSAVDQFWDAANRTFELARSGHEDDAREQVRNSLQARQAALSTTVARLLVQNNESEADTAQQVQNIYADVQRQVYVFLLVTLGAIAITGISVIRSNRRLFTELASLSEQRRELTERLMVTRESTLRELSRELHDEFGQTLTAIGSMLGRAQRRLPEESPVRADIREIGEIAQQALDSVRRLSQALHPSLLDEMGLESTMDWYMSTVERQLGLQVTYQRSGESVSSLDNATVIHVYRVLQEALSNIVRHSGTRHAWVRLHGGNGVLRLEVEDHGKGMDRAMARRGLGLVAMRERAELVGGSLDLVTPPQGGTLVRLTVPLAASPATS